MVVNRPPWAGTGAGRCCAWLQCLGRGGVSQGPQGGDARQHALDPLHPGRPGAAILAGPLHGGAVTPRQRGACAEASLCFRRRGRRGETWRPCCAALRAAAMTDVELPEVRTRWAATPDWGALSLVATASPTLGFLSVRPAPRARPATQPFIDDVNAFLKDKDPDTAIRQLQDTYSQLQMQEVRWDRAQSSCRESGALTRLPTTGTVCPTVPPPATAGKATEQAAGDFPGLGVRQAAARQAGARVLTPARPRGK